MFTKWPNPYYKIHSSKKAWEQFWEDYVAINMYENSVFFRGWIRGSTSSHTILYCFIIAWDIQKICKMHLLRNENTYWYVRMSKSLNILWLIFLILKMWVIIKLTSSCKASNLKCSIHLPVCDTINIWNITIIWNLALSLTVLIIWVFKIKWDWFSCTSCGLDYLLQRQNSTA